MKNNFRLRSILILLYLGAVISCDKKEDMLTPDISSLPMTIGSQWTYDRQVIISRFDSETSDNTIGIDTMNFTVKVWIDKDTILNDTMDVKTFKLSENNNFVSTQYKFIDSQGLKTYAYSNAGGVVAFLKKSGYLASPVGLDFSSTAGNAMSESDNIIFEDKPTLDIIMPLDIGSSWTYRQPSESRTLQIDKGVIGTETIHLFGQSFACYKVEWNYLYDLNYSGIKIIDWISESGLVKRQIVTKRVTFKNESGEILYFGKVTETITLNELNIK
jgi:hypothetical protein